MGGTRTLNPKEQVLNLPCIPIPPPRHYFNTIKIQTFRIGVCHYECLSNDCDNTLETLIKQRDIKLLIYFESLVSTNFTTVALKYCNK